MWHGPCSRVAVALTFDDGPSEATPELLALLDRHQARGTFFQCGANVRRLPAVARAVAGAGHEIGNHGDSHRGFQFRSPRFMYEELSRAQDSIGRAAGVLPTLFRAPYGVRWPGLRQVQQQLGLLGVMWTVIGRDWTLPPAGIARRLLQGASNGAIFCLHDGREIRPNPDIRPMMEALRRVLPEIQARGFRFETVSQLLCPMN